MILGFLRRLALLPRPLGLRLLTPLLPRVEARLQAPRLFILTLLYSGVEPRIFVLPMILAFSLIYKDSSINFIAAFFFLYFANLSCLTHVLSELLNLETELSGSYVVLPFLGLPLLGGKALQTKLLGLLGYEAFLEQSCSEKLSYWAPVLCNLSYWAPEPHGSMATWPSLSSHALKN